MKKTILLGTMATLLAAAGAHAAIFIEGFSGVDVSIPVGNPVGVVTTGVVSDVPYEWSVNELTVGLDISGGYNGDLYAYLVAPNGTMVVLMDEPGVAVNNFGASGPGMNITLQDGATTHGPIQNETSGAVLSGSYNAAGTLANFNGSAADGTWTLFFADLANGGGTSVLESWSLDIVSVPEPASMGTLAGLAAVLIGWRKLSRRSVRGPGAS